MTYDVTIGDKKYRIDIAREDGKWSCRLDGRTVEVDALMIRLGLLSLRVSHDLYEVHCEPIGTALKVWVGARGFELEVRDPRSLRGRLRAADDLGARKLVAPMPGRVVRILVGEGALVEVGTSIMVVEAMKMQNEVKSPKKGTVQKILVGQGAAVNAGDILAIVE